MIGILTSDNGTTLYENVTEQDMFELYMSEIEELFDTEIYTVEAAQLNNLTLPKFYDWWVGKSVFSIKEIIAESVQVNLFSPFTLPSGPSECNEHNELNCERSECNEHSEQSEQQYYYNSTLNICTDEDSVIDCLLYHDDYAYTAKEKEAMRKLLRENKEMRGWRACKLQIPMNHCG